MLTMTWGTALCVKPNTSFENEAPSHTPISVGLLNLVERWGFYLWLGQGSKEEMLTLEALTYH